MTPTQIGNDMYRLADRAGDHHALHQLLDGSPLALHYWSHVIDVDSREQDFDVSADIEAVREELRVRARSRKDKPAVNTYGDLP